MAGRVVVCGLGPGAAGLVTDETRHAIETIEQQFLRTTLHPTAHLLPRAQAFDHVYEDAASFDEVYHTIAETLVEAAADQGEILYAVPGSPLVLERSVRNLKTMVDDRDVEIALLPAVSFLDQTWSTLGVDPVDDGVRLIDGHRFVEMAAAQTGPLLVAHTHAPWVLSDIKLAVEAEDSCRVMVLQRLGTDSEKVFEVAWSELDRSVEPDHLTSLYIPELATPVGHELIRSVELMATLRRRCPWDREQTHETLRSYLIEESYEVLDALDDLGRSDYSGEAYANLEEELGDLWFQILFHSQLAQEQGQFTIADVARGLYEKMVSRHPHVFDPEQSDSTTVPTGASWDERKREEKQRTSMFDGIPQHLPALAKTAKSIKRASLSGTPPDPNLPMWGPGRSDDDPARWVGQELLKVVAWATDQNVDPELALRAALTEAIQRAKSDEKAGRTVSETWLLG